MTGVITKVDLLHTVGGSMVQVNLNSLFSDEAHIVI